MIKTKVCHIKTLFYIFALLRISFQFKKNEKEIFRSLFVQIMFYLFLVLLRTILNVHRNWDLFTDESSRLLALTVI